MSLLISLAVAAVQTAAPATLHTYSALALAPAADRFADVESDEPIGASSDVHGVVTLRSPKGAVLGRFDPCATCKYAGADWSPDGKALAFIAADAKAGTAVLYVIEGDKARAVTTIKGVAGTPRWAPDGRSIAVLATVGAHKETGATQAGARQVGEIGVAGVIDEQRIAVVPVAGGELAFASPDDTFVYEYDWTPDSKGFVGTAAKGDGDNNWWVANLQAFTLDGQARVIAAPKMQMNAPRVSPDGKSVAFIGGLMSDFGAVGGDVHLVPLAGGEPKNLTEGYKGTFTSLAWTGGDPVATAVLGGDSAIVRVDPTGTGKVTILSRGEVSYSAGGGKVSLDAKGKTAAAVVESFTQAPQVRLGALDALNPSPTRTTR